MKPFAGKLFAPRPTFPMDMTAEEGAMMARHAAYWRDLLEKKVAVAFGPVMDPAGAWGIALFYAEDETAAKSIIDNDPAYKAGLRFDIYPMGSLVH